MKLSKERCTGCSQTGGIYRVNGDTLCRYCGKTQSITTTPPDNTPRTSAPRIPAIGPK